MGSTYHSLHYHIIFSTKDRRPWLIADQRERIFDYIGGTIAGLKGTSHGVGGVEDHVHILCSLTPSHCLADFVRDLKKSTSTWTKDALRLPEFAWQDGYAGLTVSPSGRPAVHEYIKNQEQHHKKTTFIDELKEFLKKAEIKYDPKYLL